MPSAPATPITCRAPPMPSTTPARAPSAASTSRCSTRASSASTSTCGSSIAASRPAAMPICAPAAWKRPALCKHDRPPRCQPAWPRSLQMREEGRLVRTAAMHAVDIADRNLRQLLFADPLEAADVDPVHLADRRVVADAERPHAAPPAEEVLVLAGVESVLGQLCFARDQAKSFRPG